MSTFLVPQPWSVDACNSIKRFHLILHDFTQAPPIDIFISRTMGDNDHLTEANHNARVILGRALTRHTAGYRVPKYKELVTTYSKLFWKHFWRFIYFLYNITVVLG